ncbi:hypothetical protein LQZ18_01670 [Lachnospiraceae bacterium ZAX-1]
MPGNGIGKLALVLQQRTHDLADKPSEIDFGTIQGDMSLVQDFFPKAIPQADYMMCGKGISAGDRVLVVRRGNDFCIVGKIRPGTG